MYQQPPNQPQQTGYPQYPPQNTYYPPQQPPSYPPQPQGQWPQPPKKKRKKWPIILLVLALIVAVIVLASSLSSKGDNTATSTTNTTTTATQAATGHTASQQATWKTTHTFTGNGSKKTAVFSVPDDWKMVYSCNGMIAGTAVDGVLGVNVYNSDGSIADPAAVNATCKAGSAKTTGETEEHQSGNVYLDINGTGDWTIQVQELK